MTKFQPHANDTHANNKGRPSIFGTEELVEAAKQNGEVMIRAIQTATTGANQVIQALAGHSQSLTQLSIAAFQAAISARTLAEVVRIQTDYARNSMDHFVRNGTQITEMTVKIANDSAEPIKQHADEAMRKFKHQTAA